MKTLEKVKIVDYHDGYAQAVAKMWNESSENWGGDESVSTAQDIIDTEAKSTNLHLFLAVIGEEVVGYCGLSEYREDEGALYIPLLNVHPAYQGLKIGKRLLLTALDKTVELGWPRLDLFTWPGNTKAVPLYKKCGFFWEERDDATHLMNFMPTVLQIDWLRPFFEKHDWYSTSERVIEIKPDGFKAQEHTVYEYKWEAEDEFVQIQFERTGRSIRRIETQDLMVEMNLPHFKLLENEQHLASYRIVNKTDTPFEVSLSGRSSDVVNHDVNEAFEVLDTWSGEFPLKLNMPEVEPNPWKTHPVVGMDLIINQSVLPLQMGAFPIQAGKLHLRSVKKDWRVQHNGTLHLDLESELDTASTWTLKLPVNKVIQWEEPQVQAQVDAKGRLSIPLSCQLMKHGFLDEEIEVKVQRANGETSSFHTRLTLAFPGYGAKFGGQTEEYWYGYNGPHYVKIEKRNNAVKIGSLRAKEDPLTMMTPKLGKPFSDEFSKTAATSIEHIELQEAFVLKTSLMSHVFPSVILNTYYKIYGDGMVEITHELINHGREEKNDLAFLQPVIIPLKGMALPMKNGVLMGNEADIPFIGTIYSGEISERWLFTSSASGDTAGLAWPEDAVGKRDDWRFGVMYSIGTLEPGELRSLGPIQVGINTVPNWRQWRDLAAGDETKTLEELPLYNLEVESDGFISRKGEKVGVAFRSQLSSYLQGHLTVHSGEDTFTKEVRKEEAVTKVTHPLVYHTTGLKTLTGHFRSPGRKADIHALHIVKGTAPVEVFNDEDNWTVDNGVVSFQASASYYPGVYSLKYQGREALHHGYPEAGPKAWWNPWGGGIRYAMHNVSPYSMLKEKTSIDAVTKQDQCGHEWTGLCLKTTFTQHEEMNGVVLYQYALTLPETPITAFYGEIHQGSNRTFVGEKLSLEAFFKPAEDLKTCYAAQPNKGWFHTYYAGVEEFELNDSPFVQIGSDDWREKATLIHPAARQTAGIYMNQEVFLGESVQEWAARSGEVTQVEPTILFFGEETYDKLNHPFHGMTFK
ncbi:GNAT family N-acetyltransferase [Halobacillus sp. K22]|uniref:GNAT family N-acetyltransferase n=1 Tax=Halobacillus sp. K22 TaxID=3457431 RepID=UPI003FCE691D